MTDPDHDEVREGIGSEVGHSDRRDDLNTPENDDQVEPGAEAWVEDEDGAES